MRTLPELTTSWYWCRRESTLLPMGFGQNSRDTSELMVLDRAACRTDSRFTSTRRVWVLDSIRLFDMTARALGDLERQTHFPDGSQWFAVPRVRH